MAFIILSSIVILGVDEGLDTTNRLKIFYSIFEFLIIDDLRLLGIHRQQVVIVLISITSTIKSRLFEIYSEKFTKLTLIILLSLSIQLILIRILFLPRFLISEIYGWSYYFLLIRLWPFFPLFILSLFFERLN